MAPHIVFTILLTVFPMLYFICQQLFCNCQFVILFSRKCMLGRYCCISYSAVFQAGTFLIGVVFLLSILYRVSWRWVAPGYKVPCSAENNMLSINASPWISFSFTLCFSLVLVYQRKKHPIIWHNKDYKEKEIALFL